jgi:hypothetical protein
MTTKKKDELKVEETSSEAAEGARKLRLSVTRMKKMRSSIKAGGDDNGGGGVTWNHVEVGLVAHSAPLKPNVLASGGEHRHRASGCESGGGEAEEATLPPCGGQMVALTPESRVALRSHLRHCRALRACVA